ncbi:BMP family ABC transporter substrate-binding protein [Aliiroseovarius sp. KMU-50]|uniref:BMP family ABC transporter substrate-binding protein n=1 Tax=Aliiroseovarius salicola TaxID=3009082 RepID=A0ABT4W3Z4_9RHOB|nr:BMP family ABC transporter substrate-binding protein [Aliiroseovarius sp. KMU-50]MDA5095247.1 BMP family ABC transporter substrate-binding protein [Aliiroseovarius sp. KMU-50]
MTLMKNLLGAAAAVAVTAGAALADPAVIFDLGGKFDKSFNEAAYNGAKRWADETGGKYLEIELQSEAQREQALRRFAEAGASPIVTTGFAMADPVANVSADYPDTKFVNIDGFLPEIPSNVQMIAFEEHQGSYLVGVLAAMASKSGTVGFIGGMDVPLIRHFACGYAQGALATNPGIKIVANMTGNTPTAWNDPVRGGELAKAQIAQGADVVYAAAGGTGIGVLQATADADGVLSIGVDSNQNHLHPGKVLTSMLKRVDVAVYEAMKAGGDLETGIQVRLGLAEEGVGYALDDNNASLVSGDMEAAAEDAKAKIIAGDIDVVAYYTNDSCPVLDF